MSRQSIPMVDGTVLVIGWEEGLQTWFAFHYDKGEHNPPRAAIGQCEVEREMIERDRPECLFGAYPVAELPELIEEIQSVFGIEGAEDQPPCIWCNKPNYESNPACIRHPYDVLRYNL